ncbi:MAG: CBS domain-containing protein, partial [Candidatus Aenigmatarchaeota archaeon]
MDVREIMSKNFVSLGPDDTIQAFMSAMERYHIHSVPVIEKGKLLGNLEYKKLSKKGIIDPSTAKIRSFMDSPPPTLKPDSTVEKS